MAIKIHSEGAAQEVTGSRHVLSVNGDRVMIDCGAFQGRRDEADRKNRGFTTDDIDRIDALVLTHAHYDHCGLIPLLVKKGFGKNIYATPATRDLASLIMMDTANIQNRDREYLSKQAAKRGETFPWEPLFEEDDVIKATGQFVTVSYNRPLPITGNIGLEFYDAGHILGSALAVLTIADPESGKRMVVGYSGDLGRKHTPIIRDPASIPAVDYLVLESTYGDRLHESQEGALEKLASVVNEAVRRGGRIIIPAFAVERTQELVYYFHILTDQKRIPELPIYVDSPMATNATSIFQVHPECYDEDIHHAFIRHHQNPFGFNSLRFVMSVDESKRLNDVKGPMVIISADGMCEAGRIQHHLIHAVEDPRNVILLVGYMAENTLGRRIQEKRPEIRIMGDIYKLRARVEEINAFSAHADYREIWDYLSGLDRSRLKRIYLVHGEPAAQAHLKAFLLEKGIADIEIVKYGEEYELA
jgi:metallo-beta-lactamase family protein